MINRLFFRACYTMLIVMALQLFCYSVVQLMVVDQLLFHVLKENYFSKVRYDFINGDMAYQLVSTSVN